MTEGQEAFLDAWRAAPRGTSAAQACRSIGQAPRAFLGWCAVDHDFREAYLTLRDHHGNGNRILKPRKPRATPEEIDQGLERFLETLEEQMAAGGPANQALAAREAGISIGSVYRRRSPQYGSYDEEFAQRYFEILGANTIGAEDRAAMLANMTARQAEELGDDGKLLTSVVAYLKVAPGSTHVDRRLIQGSMRHDHQHRHAHLHQFDMPALAGAVGEIADRFQLSAAPDELDLAYDAEYVEMEAPS